MAYKLIYNPLIDYIRSHVQYASAWFYYIVRLPVYVQWNGILWHASQIYCVAICTYDGIKVGLLYNNAGYVI